MKPSRDTNRDVNEKASAPREGKRLPERLSDLAKAGGKIKRVILPKKK